MTPYRTPAAAPRPTASEGPQVTVAMLLRAAGDLAWDYALALGPTGIVLGGFALTFSLLTWLRP